MKFWVGVASRDHVQRGMAGGYCQLCHGKAQPLKRMAKGDWIVYYSGKELFDQPTLCQRFTAIGKVIGDEVYPFKMMSGFISYRRNIHFHTAKPVDIRPLIDALSFIKDKSHWGSVFRFGHLGIPANDFRLIARSMLGFDPTMEPERIHRSRALTTSQFIQHSAIV